MLKHLRREGSHIVARDEDGRILKTTNGQPLASVVKAGENWRKRLARATDDGRVLEEALTRLALGEPQVKTLPDGRVSEPVIPTPEVQRAALMNLLEMMRGKAVAQTEIKEAHKATEDQLRAMTDEQLDAVIDGDYKVLPEE
jgi:hypothetical protein